MKRKISIFLLIIALILLGGLLISKATGTSFSQTITNPFAPNNPPSYAMLEKPVSLAINDLAISDVTQTSAKVTWYTSKEAVDSVYWWLNMPQGGDTVSSTINSKESLLSDNIPKVYHSYLLNNLTPGGLYFLKVLCTDENSSTSAEAYHEFSTPNVPDTIPPSDISSAEALVQEKDIALRWTNPYDSDLAGIMITRSLTTFPKNSQDGVVVFKGTATFFYDTYVSDGTTYYYLISTYDKDGNISKGVYLAVKYLKAQPSPVRNVTTSPTFPITPSIPIASGRIIEFWQNSIGLQMGLDGIKVDRETQVVLNIPAEYVPANIDQLTLLLNSGVSTYSFVFPKDNRYDSYILTIPGSILDKDYKMTLLGKTNTSEVAQADFGTLAVSAEPTPVVLTFWQRILLYIIALWGNIADLFRG